MRPLYLLIAITPILVAAAQPLSDLRSEHSAEPSAIRPFCEPEFTRPTEPEEQLIAGKKSRAGMPFTRKGKATVKQENAERNDGKNHCDNCDVETTPAQKHQKGVRPPDNETQVDHKIPKAKGGPGEPDNGQVLCRECNIEKSDKEQ